MEKEEKLGIENIEKSLDYIIDLAKKVKKALADGKITTAEWVGIGFKLIGAISTIKKFKAAIPEIKDLDSDEIQTLLIKVLNALTEIGEIGDLLPESVSKDFKNEEPEFPPQG